MFRILIATFLSFSIVFATPAAFAARQKENEISASRNKKSLQIIVFSGIAGAILGLSTLSFYGRPQDRLNNIAVGAAVGIITGTIYSTFKQATEPRDYYNLRDYTEGHFLAMQALDAPKAEPATAYAPKFQVQFSF